MTYKVVVSDEVVDKSVTLLVGANNVFDAVSMAADSLRHPYNTKLIEAVPVTEEEANEIRKEFDYDDDVLWR